MNKVKWIPAGFLFILIMSCTLIPEYNVVGFDSASWQAGYSRWMSLSLSNYEFTYNSYGFMPFSNMISVTNGTAYSLDTNQSGFTIDKIFLDILGVYSNYHGKILNRSDELYWYTNITAAYHSNYGYPDNWYYSIEVAPGATVDGNFSYSISGFRAF